MRRNRLNLLLVILIALCSMLFSSGVVSPIPSQADTRFVTFGGGQTGGSLFIITAAIANVFEKYNPDVKAQTMVTAASTENVRRLGMKQLDFGIATADTPFYAFHGEREFKEKYDNLRFVMRGSEAINQYLTLQKSGIKSITDFKGRTIGLQTGVVGQSWWPSVMKGYGLTEKESLVLDTLNGAAELAAAEVCATRFGGDWGPRGYLSFQQGPVATSEEMRRLLPALDRCRERGMTLILLAHAGTLRVPNPLDSDYSKWVPDVDRRIWARLAAWADVIGRAEYQHTLVKDPTGKAKALGASVRVVRFSGSAAEDVGTRVGFDLPAELPLSWEAFASALGRADDGIGVEVRELWGLLNPEEAKATLAWLGVRDLAKASPAKLRQLLNRLRQVAAARQEETNA